MRYDVITCEESTRGDNYPLMESTNPGSRKEKSVSLRLVGLRRFVLFCCLLNCLFYFLFRSRIHVFLVIIIIIVIVIIIIIIITIIIFVFILFVYVYLFTPFA